ncbi:hypothetical protein J6590_039198 [Homalodisca vitripennis]|nr:hypothetical protein J6590_039198 [Homalodisca vitripennis]
MFSYPVGVKMQSTIEQRFSIKFCVKLKKTATETLQMIQEAYGEAVRRLPIRGFSITTMHRRTPACSSPNIDVLSYVAWKLSGLPKNRVIGSGTNLDTSRLRFLVSQKLNLSVESVHGYIIGEHGDTSVPVWSGVNVAGVRLRDVNDDIGRKNDTESFNLIHKQVVDSAYEIIRLKGYTSWAIGLCVAKLCQSILHNAHSVHAVSNAAKGFHGIDQDVFLSLPCVLGENGVSHVIKQPLREEELQQLKKSAKTMADVIKGLKF